MKPRFLLLSCVLWLSACTNDSSNDTTARTSVATSSKPKTADEIREAEENKPPYIGMTKEQALARYGEPKQRSVAEDGEIWTYLLNYGEVLGKAFIPFNFKPTTIRTGTLTFGPKGKVVRFRWDTPTNG